jgi:nitrogen fixation protein FixH
VKPEVRWPLLIVGLLALQVALGAFFVWRAVSDPSFAVEEDYYEKAVQWDAHREQAARNRDLGWVLTETVVPPPAAGTDATLQVSIHDAEGGPVAGARVHVEAFHNVRAGRVLRADLEEIEPGRYAAPLPMRRPGLWEVRTAADRGGDHFTHVGRLHLGGR